MNFKRLLFLVKVEGLSGFPHLRPGRRYLATSFGKPREGDFIIFRDKNNQDSFLVKKVFAREEKKYLASSTFPKSERGDFYSVPKEHVEGKLILR